MSSMFEQALIVADDLGIDPDDDEVILDAAAKGFISGISVAATTPRLAYLSARLRALPDILKGVHLNLTEGFPLLTGERCSTLVSGDEAFDFKNSSLPMSIARITNKAQSDGLFREQSLRELREQLQRFANFLGAPQFINYHHHLHLSYPWFDEKLVELAAEFRCKVVRGWVLPITTVFETPNEEKGVMYHRRESRGFPTILSFSNVREGTNNNVDKSCDYLSELLSFIRHVIIGQKGLEIIEVIIHPGKYRHDDLYGWIRDMETDILPYLHQELFRLQQY